LGSLECTIRSRIFQTISGHERVAEQLSGSAATHPQPSDTGSRKFPEGRGGAIPGMPISVQSGSRQLIYRGRASRTLRPGTSMIKIKHRLKKLERRLLPSDVGTCTLEELCRAMWRQDKRQFLEIAKSSSLSLLARQFEIDDIERGRADCHMGIRILDVVVSIRCCGATRSRPRVRHCDAGLGCVTRHLYGTRIRVTRARSPDV
jgi:hypothetical protein